MIHVYAPCDFMPRKAGPRVRVFSTSRVFSLSPAGGLRKRRQKLNVTGLPEGAQQKSCRISTIKGGHTTPTTGVYVCFSAGKAPKSCLVFRWRLGLHLMLSLPATLCGKMSDPPTGGTALGEVRVLSNA